MAGSPWRCESGSGWGTSVYKSASNLRIRSPPRAPEYVTMRVRSTEMDLRQALKEQYHAGLAMLAECVDKCPEGMWLEGEPPRAFWRIAWHAAYFTHNYLVQNEEAFNGSVADWPLAVRTALGVSDTQKAVD